MEYMSKTLVELHNDLKSGNVSSDELVAEALKKSHLLQERCNAFVTILDDARGRSVTLWYKR